MMQKGEGVGVGLSIIGHVGLLALLSLNLMSVREMPKLNQPMDVMLVDKAGLVSAAPQMAEEPPKASEAPEIAPAPEPEPLPEPIPTPPRASPAPPKPAVTPKVAVKPAPPTPAVSKAKPKATTLSNDFLKGIPVDKSAGKGEAPRVAAISPIAMNGLIALIASQVKPCYTIPVGGADTSSIVSRVRLRLKKDGSIGVAPEVVGNLGVNSANQSYLRQMNEAAMRALKRCAPYKLPADLYEGGWEDLIFRFNPAQLG
jgi:hypothetical protein